MIENIKNYLDNYDYLKLLIDILIVIFLLYF